jgi:FMN phosphatase YigB (HAD superfamily)
MERLDPPVKQLLVDLDGTLLGNRAFPLSIDFTRRAIQHLKRFGGVRLATSTLLAIYRELSRPSKELTNDIRVVQLFARRMNLGLEEARQVLRESISAIFPQLRRHFYPVAGSREFLLWAQRHYPLFLATNPVWSPEIVELRLRWAEIEPAWFSSMTHVRKMHATKPHPEYYDEILAELKRAPSECLLLGDDVKMDLPATKVGIRVFIVGEYPKLERLAPKYARAPAWKGNYAHLRQLLEGSLIAAES